MRLGLTLSSWDTPDLATNIELAQEAERLGYSVCWAPEAYGFDAATVLATVAARTSRIDIGSAVLQIPGRSPAMTAMTAATLDALSGGRFRLGLGVSGPQVSEGWHGVRFARPLARTREYVDVVRQVLRREPLAYDGEHHTLPLPNGPGKVLRLSVRPVRDRIPIYLAAMGPANLALAGEIADGWLGVFVAPDFVPESLGYVRTGRQRAGDVAGGEGGEGPGGEGQGGDNADLAGFDVVACVPVVTGDDVEACAAPVRGYAALYLGGMGSRDQNFYNDLATRMGYPKEAARVQDLYLARQHRDAAAAVPVQFVDDTSLLGTADRIAARLGAYADAGVTTVSVLPFGATVEERLHSLRTTADALQAAGVGE